MDATRSLARTIVCLVVAANGAACRAEEPTAEARALAAEVLIHRDEFGVPHVLGKSDASTFFGFGYAQAEDYFWQVEDAYILSLGRYSEIHGPQGFNSDLLNRAFEIVPRSQRDYAALDRTTRRLCEAFVGGINYYLQAHPDVRPRLLTVFEPWQVLAYYRQVALELCFRLTGLTDEYLPRRNPQIWNATGSNGWAIGPQRTRDRHPMLLANPHMPWFGFAQLAEAHLISEGSDGERGWNFSGAGFYGCPALALGHNERLGWTLVTNEPDIADVWRVRFTDAKRPLAYEYDGQYRLAEQWSETIRVRKSGGFEDRLATFRKTHHGPIVAREDERTMLAAQIAGLYETAPLRQALQMKRARNLAEFRTALGALQMLYMNVLYADCDGNVLYLYNGRIPRRNPDLDWSRPVDGSDPAAEWLGVHDLDELPQILNPSAGFLQNCNSSPAIATDGGNPALDDFPRYMLRDGERRNRRALRSLEILRSMNDVDFAQWQQAAFDTDVYWARQELPRYARVWEEMQRRKEPLATQVRPYLEHLLAWDGRITADSTAAALCHAWYEQLYGSGYPGETLRAPYVGDEQKQLAALVRAADQLLALHGTWQPAYGDIFRIQRVPRTADLFPSRFDDRAPSLPSVGGHGPMGVVFTQYYTPSLNLPLLVRQRRRYAIVGTSYLAAYEFPPAGARGTSVVPLGASGDPRSPHFFDQADLLSRRQFKPEHFTADEAQRAAVRSYRPGEDVP